MATVTQHTKDYRLYMCQTMQTNIDDSGDLQSA